MKAVFYVKFIFDSESNMILLITDETYYLYRFLIN